MLRPLALLAALAIGAAFPASAQLPDATSLKGVYNVRYLGVLLYDSSGNPAYIPIGFSGTFTFDGGGNFAVNGSGISSGSTLKFNPTGHYTVYSSGSVEIDNPFDLSSSGTTLYGGLGANGLVIASSTESIFCDHFVAVPAATTASLSTLNGAYRVAHMEFLAGDVAAGARDTFFTMTANGSGSLGNVSVQGTSMSLNGAATTQQSVAATYTMTANGSGTLVFPAPSGVAAANVLLSGSKTLYVSADGSFFVAGSPSGYDFIVGARSATTGPNGLYWLSYVNNYASGGQSEVIGVSGSASENSSNGQEIAHERTNDEYYYYPFDNTYADTFKFDSTGTVDLTSSTGFPSAFAAGANGDVLIGAGAGFNYMVAVYVKAPTLKGSGVFLNPQGIVNAATFAPFTAQVAPGEMVTLFGSGMGPDTPAVAIAPFPTTLGGVQVLINGTPVPLYVVSATQITCVVPYNLGSGGGPLTTGGLTFQVVYNNVKSNTASVYAGTSSPGLFTTTQNGIGVGDVVHPSDGSVASSTNPVKAGETVSLYLNGLGPVTPAVAAGTPAPTNPLSLVQQPVFVSIGGVDAKVVFQGLAPGFAGLYQLNVTIPAGLTPGPNSITVFTSLENGNAEDAQTSQATVTVAQ